MLPSLIRTLECGFRYVLVMGFDQGDLLFDAPHTKVQVSAWLDEHLVKAAAARGIQASFLLLSVRNDLKKPGPVFNAMAKTVSKQQQQQQQPLNSKNNEEGDHHLSKQGQRNSTGVADYIYRVNDDTEFATSEWTSKFVRALAAMSPPNVGVVGPSCPQGNRAILTHDFTHRSHMEIFGTGELVSGANPGREFGSYYPPVLSDWFMDDWISRVYGSRRTKLMKDVEVVHHSKTYGRRYDVDGKHRHLVDELVENGKQRVLGFMKRQGASEKVLKSYSSDHFNQRQQQKEVDQSTIARKSTAVRPPGHR
jgi:hypothetical protein